MSKWARIFAATFEFRIVKASQTQKHSMLKIQFESKRFLNLELQPRYVLVTFLNLEPPSTDFTAPEYLFLNFK